MTDAPPPSTPASAPAPSATHRRRRWPWILGGGVLGLALVVGLAVPWLVARALAGRIVHEFEARGAPGNVEHVRVSWTRGVRTGAAQFASADGRMQVAWNRIDWRLRWRGLLATPRHLGELCTVHGLVIHLELPLPHDGDSGAPGQGGRPTPSTAQPFTVRLPQLELPDARIVVLDGRRSLMLEAVSLTAQPTTLTLPVSDPLALVEQIPFELAFALTAEERATRLTAARVTVEGTGQGVELELPRAALNGGLLDAHAKLAGGAWSLTLDAREVVSSEFLVEELARISPLLALARSAPASVRCLLGLEARASGNLRGPDPLATISAEGTLRSSAGELAVTPELRPLLALLPERTQGLLAFEPYEQPFVIHESKVLNRGFQLVTAGAPIVVEGYTTLSGELHHRLRLDQAVVQALGGRAGRRELQLLQEVLPEVTVELGGTLTAPQLHLPDVPGAHGVLEGLLRGGARLLESEASPARPRNR